MKSTLVSILFAAIVMSGFTFFVAKDIVQVLTTSDTHSAVIVKCDSKQARSYQRRSRNNMKSFRSYAPVAVSQEGYQATGSLWVTSKSLCEGMIGRKTSILVNQDNPEKARIKSFFQLWLFPLVILFFIVFGVACILRNTKIAIGIFAGFFLFGGTATAIEFGVFNGAVPQSDLPPVNPELALKTCINQAMREQGVQTQSELTQLTCRKRELTGLSELALLTSLEELDLSGNHIGSLKLLSSLSQLQTLTLTGNKELLSLTGIENLQNLESLIVHCAGLREIDAIKDLKNLRHLDVSCNAISDISVINNLEKLERLNIDTNSEITDISAVANKPLLEIFGMYHTPVNDISPLFGNDKLRSVNIGSKGKVPCTQINELRGRLTKSAQIRGVKHCAQK